MIANVIKKEQTNQTVQTAIMTSGKLISTDWGTEDGERGLDTVLFLDTP